MAAPPDPPSRSDGPAPRSTAERTDGSSPGAATLAEHTPRAPTPPTDDLATTSGHLRAMLRSIGPVLLTVVLALLIWPARLHGTDLAAQVYRAEVVRRHGLVLWDDGWYGGNYPWGYSVLAPVVGAGLGLVGTFTVAAGIATLCFDRIVTALPGRDGRRNPAVWYFAVTVVIDVAIGQAPYLLGEAAGLAAFLALMATARHPLGRSNRTRIPGGRHTSLALLVAVLLGVVTVLFSPLAGAFLVMACAIWAILDRDIRFPAVAVALVCCVVVGLTELPFPGAGAFPYAWPGFLIVEAFCLFLLSPLVVVSRVIRLAAFVYGLACLASFLVANPLGGNADRLAQSVGIPVVLAAVGPSQLAIRRGRMARRQVVTALALTAAVVWQWSPGWEVVTSRLSPGATAASASGFYRPLVARLETLSAGRPVRVEVVPEVDHWESAYVAPRIPLARGWDRQLDVGDDDLFYAHGGHPSPAAYRAWLLDDGVEWVALSNAPVDPAAVAERRLLEGGRVPGLRLVWSDAAWRLWQVEGSPGLSSGPGRLVAEEPDRLALDITAPGTLLVRVRWTSYWGYSGSDRPAACVAESPGGWTEVRATAAGSFTLRFALFGGTSADCPTPARRATARDRSSDRGLGRPVASGP